VGSYPHIYTIEVVRNIVYTVGSRVLIKTLGTEGQTLGKSTDAVNVCRKDSGTAKSTLLIEV
jgi:hypothetical protein